MNLFKEFTLEEQPLKEPEESAVKLPVLYEHSWYSYDACKVRVVSNEDWEWGVLGLDLDCEGPPVNHWLSYMFEAVGNLNEVLDLGHSHTEKFLIDCGIAPKQPFYLWMSFSTWRDYWGEYEEEVDWGLAGIVPWSIERAATEWEAFYCRGSMMIYG
jgi:hypothetical protein